MEEELKENRKKIVNYKLQVEILPPLSKRGRIFGSKITEVEAAKLLKLEENLHKRIISQEKAVGTVARVIRRNRSAEAQKGRPPLSSLVLPA